MAVDLTAILAALGALIVASPAFFFIGRRLGTRAEHDRQAAAKATAEESSKRIIGEAEREAENLRKSAVVAGMNSVKPKVNDCYTQFKVPGMAMVNVVISPSGKVSSATVTGKFAGTPTGSCVEGAVKSASFPPSEGLSTPYPFNLR